MELAKYFIKNNIIKLENQARFNPDREKDEEYE